MFYDCCVLFTGVCNDGDVRLVDGPSLVEGRVEICLAEQWGPICGASWNTASAAVVCYQLGSGREGN